MKKHLSRLTKGHLSLIFKLLLTCSCTYEPEIDFFKEIELSEPKASISLNGFSNSDTIQLFSGAEFNFTVGVERGNIQIVQVLFNDTKLMETGSTSGNFTLGYPHVKTGTFELKIQLITTSGSGSFADQVGVELFQVWRKWVVKIDVDIPPKPVIKFSTENGFLKINWPKYTKKNFHSYLFWSRKYPTGKTFIITDPDQTSVIDSSYVGGYEVEYSVLVRTTTSLTNGDMKVRNDPQEFKLTYRASDSTAIMQWRKPFTSAFKDFQITENGTIRANLTAMNDTTYSMKLDVYFGKDQEISFQVNPKYPLYAPFTASVIIKNPINAKKLHGNPALYYNSTINSVVGYKWDVNNLCFYDGTMQAIDSISVSAYGLHIPFLGNFAYAEVNAGIRQINLFSKNYSDLPISYPPAPSAYIQGPSHLTGSANKIVSYSYYAYPSGSRRYVENVYDINSGTMLREVDIYKPYGNEYFPAVVSDDGTYTYNPNGRTIYKLVNNALTYAGTIPLVGIFKSFRPDNNSEIILTNKGTTIICSSDNLSIGRTIYEPASGYVFSGYDPVSKYIVYAKADTYVLYLVHIETSEVKSVPVYLLTTQSYKLLNGVLFWIDGSYIKLF